MDNEYSYYEKCVNSCPYNAPDNLSVITLNSREEDSNNYDPENLSIQSNFECLIPYTFRINVPSRTSGSRTVICPPFYLQLDHTIAVIWKLFDSDKNGNLALGIGQLQWALYFLKAIKDPAGGKRSRDIELAIRTVEDTLLECYADMASVVMRSPPPQGIPCIICNLERNLPKTEYRIRTSNSWHLQGQPRRSGQKEKENLITDFREVKSSSLPPEPVVRHKQTDEQLRNEIYQLKNLALTLSTTKSADFKRKKVQIKSFSVVDTTNF